MGGYGCGGQNRTHDYISRYKRLDSFDFGKLLPLMERKGEDHIESSMSWRDGSSIDAMLYLDRLKVCYTASEEERKIRDDIYFDGVDNNYGGAQRFYFVCPYCGRRCRILYIHRVHFKCRLCARLNYYSQQVTKGTDAAADRMEKFIKNKFGVKERLSPMDAERYIPDRPKGMHTKTYNRLLMELSALQYKYSREWIETASRLFGLSLYL